jgi:hypothetical protein
VVDNSDEAVEERLPTSVPGTKLGLTILAMAMSAPGVPPPVQAAAPAVALIPAFLDYLQDTSARAWARVRSMSEEAVNGYPEGAQALLTRLGEDERLTWMLDTSIDASARSQTERHARAIGRALASGALAADDAQIDEATQMLRIVADLGGGDWRVLEVMARFPNLEGATVVEGQLSYILVDDLVGHTRGLSSVSVQSALAVLQRHGLVGTVALFDAGSGWFATPVADAVLAFVRNAADRS